MDWLCGGEDREGHPIDSILFASRDVPHRTCPPRGGQGRQTMDLVGLPPREGQGRHQTDFVFFVLRDVMHRGWPARGGQPTD